MVKNIALDYLDHLPTIVCSRSFANYNSQPILAACPQAVEKDGENGAWYVVKFAVTALGRRGSHSPRPSVKKFFGSFFQKRTA
jgi:hypothetical protein